MNTCELCNNTTDEELERCDECGRKCCADCLAVAECICQDCLATPALDDDDDDDDFDLDEDAWPEGDDDDDDDEAFD